MPEKLKGYYKNLAFEFKEVQDSEEKRIIKGYASTKDLDRENDIVEPEAFKKSIKQFIKSNGVLLYNHRFDQPVGKIIKAKVDDKGLYVEAEIAKNVPLADEVWELIKQGVLKTFSFGFIPLETDWDEEKEIRYIKSLDLLEVSIVTVPANPNAVFTVEESKILEVEFEEKKPSGDTSLPLADRDRPWDKQRAIASVRKWASSDGSGDKDKINWSKYRKAFFWYDENDPENFGSYKLPFAEVIDGKLYAVPRGVFAAAAAVQGARGGVDIPEKDIPGVKRKIAAYYKKMGETPPWEKGYYGLEEVEFLIEDIVAEEVVKAIAETEKKFEEFSNMVASFEERVKQFEEFINKFGEKKEEKYTKDNKLDENDDFVEKLLEELQALKSIIN